MLTLQCKIQITAKTGTRRITFDYVQGVEVRTSCRNLTDTATIRIPRRMSWQGKPITDFLKRDDQIQIDLGYAEHGLKTVFKGYINSVENSNPIAVSCENEMRRFKGITVKAERIKNFDLKSFIGQYAPDVEVVCPDTIDFGTVTLEPMNLAQCLDKLMETFTWLKCYFSEGKLIAITDMEKLADANLVKLSPERNLVSDSLKYEVMEDVKIAVKGTTIKKDNTKMEVLVPEAAGNEYEQRHFYFPGLSSEAALKAAAQQKLNGFVSDRMSGRITALGVPHVNKGDIVELHDSRRAERNGKKFFAEEVDYSFGQNGYRQTITLGYQLK